jgi:hypothetical protein
VGFVVRVDGAADLRHPEGDAEVDEDGEGVAEPVAVEGALGFSDRNRVESAVRVAEGLEEFVGAGPALPGQGAAVAGVEVLGDDLSAGSSAAVHPPSGPAGTPGISKRMGESGSTPIPGKRHIPGVRGLPVHSGAD